MKNNNQSKLQSVLAKIQDQNSFSMALAMIGSTNQRKSSSQDKEHTSKPVYNIPSNSKSFVQNHKPDYIKGYYDETLQQRNNTSPPRVKEQHYDKQLSPMRKIRQSMEVSLNNQNRNSGYNKKEISISVQKERPNHPGMKYIKAVQAVSPSVLNKSDNISSKAVLTEVVNLQNTYYQQANSRQVKTLNTEPGASSISYNNTSSGIGSGGGSNKKQQSSGQTTQNSAVALIQTIQDRIHKRNINSNNNNTHNYSNNMSSNHYTGFNTSHMNLTGGNNSGGGSGNRQSSGNHTNMNNLNSSQNFGHSFGNNNAPMNGSSILSSIGGITGGGGVVNYGGNINSYNGINNSSKNLNQSNSSSKNSRSANISKNSFANNLSISSPNHQFMAQQANQQGSCPNQQNMNDSSSLQYLAGIVKSSPSTGQLLNENLNYRSSNQYLQTQGNNHINQNYYSNTQQISQNKRGANNNSIVQKLSSQGQRNSSNNYHQNHSQIANNSYSNIVHYIAEKKNSQNQGNKSFNGYTNPSQDHNHQSNSQKINFNNFLNGELVKTKPNLNNNNSQFDSLFVTSTANSQHPNINGGQNINGSVSSQNGHHIQSQNHFGSQNSNLSNLTTKFISLSEKNQALHNAGGHSQLGNNSGSFSQQTVPTGVSNTNAGLVSINGMKTLEFGLQEFLQKYSELSNYQESMPQYFQILFGVLEDVASSIERGETNFISGMLDVVNDRETAHKAFSLLRGAVDTPIFNILAQNSQLQQKNMQLFQNLQQLRKENFKIEGYAQMVDQEKNQYLQLLKLNNIQVESSNMAGVNAPVYDFQQQSVGINAQNDLKKKINANANTNAGVSNQYSSQLQTDYELLQSENQKLKHLARKQRSLMLANRNKQEKIMKLLHAIRIKGIDIEEIYNESVKTPDKGEEDAEEFEDEQYPVQLNDIDIGGQHEKFLKNKNDQVIQKFDFEGVGYNGKNGNQYEQNYEQAEEEENIDEGEQRDGRYGQRYNKYSNDDGGEFNQEGFERQNMGSNTEDFPEIKSSSSKYNHLSYLSAGPQIEDPNSFINGNQYNVEDEYNMEPNDQAENENQYDAYNSDSSSDDGYCISVPQNDYFAERRDSPNQRGGVGDKNGVGSLGIGTGGPGAKTTMFKNQLKLDLTTLQPGAEPDVVVGQALQEPVGFHQQFMARYDEFSESWRQAMNNEQKF